MVYDLYTGTGTIAQFIAKKAKKVIGVEAVPDAIKAAKENALQNKINNIDFFVGDMKTVFNNTFIQTNGHPDVIITDPPRDGMHKDVIHQILRILPSKIVYVSCNSATQARDLAILNPSYSITKTQAVGLFAVSIDNQGNEVTILGEVVNSRSIIELPLNGSENQTQFKLYSNYDIVDNEVEGNPDVISIAYETESIYVSRACGYKNNFSIQGFSIEQDIDLWMISTEITISEVTNENESHVKIFH